MFQGIIAACVLRTLVVFTSRIVTILCIHFVIVSQLVSSGEVFYRCLSVDRLFSLRLKDWIKCNLYRRFTTFPNWDILFAILSWGFWQRRNVFLFEGKLDRADMVFTPAKVHVRVC